MATDHECLDCRKEDPDGARPFRKLDTEKPPRCYTHQRALLVRQRKQAKARHTERTYDISAEDNHELYLYQGGKCWICGKATGASKSLAVEHDHDDDWVRGRCCSTCNQFITRQLDDSAEKAQRLVRYLSGDTPFRRMLAERVVRAHNPDAQIDSLQLQIEPTEIVIWFRSGSVVNSVRTTLETLNTFRKP